MTEPPPPLLQAVLQAPEDDAPRLAFADWCEQQSDPETQARGQFIRAQLRMAQPNFEQLDGPERYRVTSIAAGLERQHGVSWASPLGPVATRHGFQRGFVAWVQTSAADFLAEADRLFALAPIRHVDLTAVRDVNEQLFASPHLRRLRSLAMERCGLYDIHLQLLADSAQLEGLRWLSVAHNHLGPKAAEALAASKRLPALRFADFTGNPSDPTEQLGLDSGAVVASSMPQEGLDLEARHGPLPWLHRDDPLPQRFSPQ